MPPRFVALGLVVIIVAGGMIGLMPVKNQIVIRVGMQGDRLFDGCAPRPIATRSS